MEAPRIRLALCAIPALLLGSSFSSSAQTTAGGETSYPQKAVRLIVPYPAGGPADLLGRIVAQKLTDVWHQQVVVDNRGGANTIIAMDLAAKAPADGYTLVMGTTAMAINPGLMPKLSYDGVRDFAPISNLVYSSFMLVVHPSTAAHSVKELIALAKAHPGALVFGSGGPGSPTHLSGELFKAMARVDMVHVPYKGMAPALSDLLGGQISLLFSDPLVALPHVKSGKLRALGVTSVKRFPAAPEVPTIAESGMPGYESGIWYGLLAPAGTPRAVVDKVHDEVVRLMAQPDVQQRMAGVGALVIADTPEHFAATIRTDTQKWTRVAKRVEAPKFDLPTRP